MNIFIPTYLPTNGVFAHNWVPHIHPQHTNHNRQEKYKTHNKLDQILQSAVQRQVKNNTNRVSAFHTEI